jgi:hypothetical protein
LVKLCRSDLNLSWMCRNATNFYRHIVPHLDVNRLPFSVPYFLSGNNQYIILQEVKNIHTFPLTMGCPPNKVHFCYNQCQLYMCSVGIIQLLKTLEKKI